MSNEPDSTGYGEKEDPIPDRKTFTLTTRPVKTIFSGLGRPFIVLLNDEPIGTIYPPNEEVSEWLTTLMKGTLRLKSDPSEFSQTSRSD
jgi:hypothetical protein